MKKLFAIVATVLFAGLSLCGCGKSEGGGAGLSVAGNWHLVSWSESKPEYLDVYINFSGRSFTLYQRVDSHEYKKFTGSFVLSGTSLTGKYADGKELGGSPYEVAFKGSKLSLTSKSGDVSLYESCKEIPAEVESAMVRTADVDDFRFL